VKRIIVAGLGMFALSAALSGCGGSSGSSPASTASHGGSQAAAPAVSHGGSQAAAPYAKATPAHGAEGITGSLPSWTTPTGAYELGWADAYTDETANKTALPCTTGLANVSQGHPGIDVPAWAAGCKAGDKAGQAADS
jgi:ABC-type phosphate transport system substrate-binding protein